MAKLPISELLRLACMYAEQDRESFIAAYAHMPDDEAAKKAVDFLAQLQAYRVKRWGKTRGERLLENAKPVSPHDLACSKSRTSPK